MRDLNEEFGDYKEKINELKTVLCSFAEQVIDDINGIESEILPPNQTFAEWSSVANTRRWAVELLEKYKRK